MLFFGICNLSQQYRWSTVEDSSNGDGWSTHGIGVLGMGVMGVGLRAVCVCLAGVIRRAMTLGT